MVKEFDLPALLNEPVGRNHNASRQFLVACHKYNFTYDEGTGVITVHARLLGILKNSFPTLHDILAFGKCRPAGMNAEYGMFSGP